MTKKKYYVITTSMKFEKTVLVPVDSVEDIDDAIDLVDCEIEIGGINILNEEPDCETYKKDICELTDNQASYYEIIEGWGVKDDDEFYDL